MVIVTLKQRGKKRYQCCYPESKHNSKKEKQKFSP